VVAVTLLDRIIGIFSLCLLACVAVLAIVRFDPIANLWLYFVIFVGCMTPVLGFYFIKPLGQALRWLVGTLRPLSWDRGGSSILDYLGEFKARKPLILELILISVVIQSLRVFTHILVALSLGIDIDPTLIGLFFVFVPLLSLAMIPPITINGLGIREGLGILLFSQAGIGQTDAFAIEFLTYIVSVSISLLGLVSFLSKGVVRRKPKDDLAVS
ncbi:MAG: flippase-like domain-containing protein, partial [Candidatus Latescibacterota bacterium]